MKYPKHPGIYAIIHVESGRLYIGSSVNIYSRWRQHKGELNNNRHHSPYFQRAWNKYGADAFEWRVLEMTLRESVILEAREDYWMSQFQGLLFNSSKTARQCLGRKMPEEAKAKMQARMQGNQNSAGHHNGKLNDRSALEIMYRYAAGERSDKLASDYDVTKATIIRVVNRKVWWHVVVTPEIEAKCREMSKSHGTAEPLVLPVPPPEPDAFPVAKLKRPRKQKPRYETKPRPKRIAVSCGICGIEMLITPCRFKAHKSHYCSKECRKAGFSKRVTEEMKDPAKREHLRQINLGKRHTKETREKMSESHRLRNASSDDLDHPVTPNTAS